MRGTEPTARGGFAADEVGLSGAGGSRRLRSRGLMGRMCLARLSAVLAVAGLAAQQPVEALLAAARTQLAPDRRVAVFEVAAERRGDDTVLRGKIHDAAMHRRLLEFLRGHDCGPLVDELLVLPDPALGGADRAVVSVSVANLRTATAHSAEMGTQALLGTPLRVLERQGDWLHVQTPNGYLGWTQDRIVSMDAEQFEAWRRGDKVIVTATFAVVRSGAAANSDPVGDVVAGCILGCESAKGADFAVRYPDGRRGFLPRQSAQPLAEWLRQAEATPARIVATARRFLGVPYLWGGTSTKGMDCSGFTSTVYLLNGTLLPRDASQQVQVGIDVPLDDLLALQPGDLLFFGSAAEGDRPERVRHVGIALGGMRLIHASIDVRISSLDPQADDFSASLRRSLLHARRIIGGGVAQLRDLPGYGGP